MSWWTFTTSFSFPLISIFHIGHNHSVHCWLHCHSYRPERSQSCRIPRSTCQFRLGRHGFARSFRCARIDVVCLSWVIMRFSSPLEWVFRSHRWGPAQWMWSSSAPFTSWSRCGMRCRTRSHLRPVFLFTAFFPLPCSIEWWCFPSVDSIIYFWILQALMDTIQELDEKKQTSKLGIFRQLRNIVVICAICAVSYNILFSFFLFDQVIATYWQYQWL